MTKVFKKSDIKSGMLVKTRNGEYFTVVDAKVTVDDKVGLAVVSGSNSRNKYFPLDNYDDELIFAEDLGVPVRNPDYDVVEVWGHTYPKFAMDNDTYDRMLLWSRPENNGKKWDEMTDEEKDAICEKQAFCGGCPYEKECDADGEDKDKDEDEDEDEDEDIELSWDDYETKHKADVDEEDVAALLDKFRNECKDDPLAEMIFEVLGDDLPEGYVDYILGKTDKNPERKAPVCGKKSLAEQLYENDKELANDGVSVTERDMALLAAMHIACGNHKD